MKFTCFSLCMLFGSLVAEAAPFSLDAQIIGARGKLEPDRKTFAEPRTGFSMRGLQDIDESVTAPGFGLHATYELNPLARVGGELDWINYDQGDSKPQYQDMSGALNASYDFYRINMVAFYGLGGFSYHRLEPKDRTLAGETTSMDNANLVNLDLGIGGRVGVASSISLDIAYRYSDSIQTDDVAVDTSGPAGLVRSTLEDTSLRTSQFLASVGYQF